MSRKLAETLLQREKKLREARSNWEQLWQSIARYCLPTSANFTEEVSPGLERTRWILDSTAPRALEMFASFLHTLLNNPASDWVKFTIEGDSRVAQETSVRQYLEECQKRVMMALVSPSADIYSQLHQIYLDIGAFGTAVMYEDVIKDELRLRVYHLEDCVIDEGESEQIDTVFRQRCDMTKRQAMQRFPKEKLGREFERVTDKEMDEVVRFVHAVFPASDAVALELPKRQLMKGSAYYSCWILDGRDKLIVEFGNYEEFPYFVPRWYKARNEVYGRSQAMTALPDIRMVNRMADTILRGAEKIVDPPLYMPDGALVSPVRVHPGGMTFTEGPVEIRSIIPPGTSRIETGQVLMEQRQTAIKEAFFTPLFVTPDSPVKTATQVLQEVDERNRALSPMLVRMQTELFSKMLMRTFRLLQRAGLLPQAPAQLAGQKLKIEYVSPLIASQKQMEGLAIARSFEQLAPWAQVDKGIFDWVDTDLVPQRILDANGVPANLVKTKTDVERVRQVRMEQQKQEQMMQFAPEAANAGAALITAGAKSRQVDNAG